MANDKNIPYYGGEIEIRTLSLPASFLTKGDHLLTRVSA